jgi:hypothetical protein
MGMKSWTHSLALAALACSIAIPARADLVNNGTFSGTVPDNGGSYTEYSTGQSFATTGSGFQWTVNNGNVDWIGSYWTAPNGNRSATGEHSVDLDGNQPGGIRDTADGTVAGQMYLLSFDLAGNPDGPANESVKTVVVTAGSTTSPQTFTFNVANGVAMGPNGSTAAGGPTSDTNMGWQVESFLFMGDGGSTNFSFISGDTDPNSLYGAAIGNVSIVPFLSQTPEPGFYGLLAAGLAGIAMARFRRPA